jgi:hypothetical protein
MCRVWVECRSSSSVRACVQDFSICDLDDLWKQITARLVDSVDERQTIRQINRHGREMWFTSAVALGECTPVSGELFICQPWISRPGIPHAVQDSPSSYQPLDQGIESE